MTTLRIKPANGPAQALVLLLHGVGASAQSMAPLARALAARLPGVTVVTPDGTYPFDLGSAGRQWFSVAGVTEDNRRARVAAALPDIEALLDQECELAGVSRDRAAVVGFSQGAILTLHLAASSDRPPAVAVALAGRLAAGPVHIGRGPRPAVFISHGANDAVMAVADGRRAAAALADLGCDAEFELIPGHGHSIDARQINSVSAFLSERLPVSVAS
jgi:phospholipase/carboxylesterase